MVIPVIFISYNNNDIFKKSFKSFIENTTKIYDLHIVDNASTDLEHINYLKHLNEKSNVTVWFNKKNLFLLGLNQCLKTLSEKKFPYYVICDSDFLYPSISDNNECWLSVLLQEMNKSPYIGKLGLSISLDNIKNQDQLKPVYKRELSFKKGMINENVWNAAVDTTPAIYRCNLFIWEDFLFYPGHMTALKPHLYTGRYKNLEGYHLGWDKDEYVNSSATISKDKVISFAKYGGAIDSIILKKISFSLRIKYKILKSYSSIYWRSVKFYFFIKYVLKRKVFLMNEINYKNS